MILSIDPSLTTGLAYLHPDTSILTTELITVKKHKGNKYHQLQSLVQQTVLTLNPDLIIIENQFMANMRLILGSVLAGIPDGPKIVMVYPATWHSVLKVKTKEQANAAIIELYPHLSEATNDELDAVGILISHSIQA
jgi:Holliday junction resolvasome RuvABC endonuclease subunit